jgi:hypothetical protein
MYINSRDIQNGGGGGSDARESKLLRIIRSILLVSARSLVFLCDFGVVFLERCYEAALGELE